MQALGLFFHPRVCLPELRAARLCQTLFLVEIDELHTRSDPPDHNVWLKRESAHVPYVVLVHLIALKVLTLVRLNLPWSKVECEPPLKVSDRSIELCAARLMPLPNSVIFGNQWQTLTQCRFPILPVAHR